MFVEYIVLENREIDMKGSAWFPQNTEYELVQLGRVAQRGFVMAVVKYRPSTVAPFPAQVKDTKTALRFMKKNAETYHVDPNNIIVWGIRPVGIPRRRSECL